MKIEVRSIGSVFKVKGELVQVLRQSTANSQRGQRMTSKNHNPHIRFRQESNIAHLSERDTTMPDMLQSVIIIDVPGHAVTTASIWIGVFYALRRQQVFFRN